MAPGIEGRSKLSLKQPPSQSTRSRSDVVESHPLDYSNLYIIFLVEADTHLSPYIYHINDQPTDSRYQVLNDKRIMQSASMREPVVSMTEVESYGTLEDGDSLENIHTIEYARKLTRAIQTELEQMQKKLSADTPTSPASGLLQREQIPGKLSFASSNPGEIFVLISTMYNPYVPKLLLESGVPIQAIVRLVDNEEFSQQNGYNRFYNNFVREYPFRRKLKRAARFTGKCQESTKQLSEDIRMFWMTLDSLRTEHHNTFRNTIFADSALPFIDLSAVPIISRATMELYRIRLYEDIRSVHGTIRNIDLAHQCYEKEKPVQNLRTLQKYDLNDLTAYKISLLTRGFNIPCIVESILKQVLQQKKHGRQSTGGIHEALSSQRPSDIMLDENNVYQLTSFLLGLTDRLDDFFVLDKSCTRSKALHARDEARLSFLQNNISQKSLETSLQLYRTFAEGVLKNQFTDPNEIVTLAKACLNGSIIDSQTQTNIHSGGVKSDKITTSTKALVDKKFYLSYYLSLCELDALRPTQDGGGEVKLLERSDELDDLKDSIRQNLFSVLEQHKHSDVSDAVRKILFKTRTLEEHGNEQQGTTKGNILQWLELMHLLDLKEKVKYIQGKIFDSSHLESLRAAYNHVENIVPDIMVQLVFSYILNANRVSFTRLPITNDVLIHCCSDSHSAKDWKFVIPTVLGLHDFYHHLVESTTDEDARNDLFTCRQPKTPTPQPPLNLCQSESFIIPDSIKYERMLYHSNSAENISHEKMESNSFGGEGESLIQDEKPLLKDLHYKYGIPQLIENHGSILTHSFHQNVKLKIERNTWTYKNVENITVLCHIRSHHCGLTDRKDHFLYYHTKIDKIQTRLISIDFHIHLSTNMRIAFKKNKLFSQYETNLFSQYENDNAKEDKNLPNNNTQPVSANSLISSMAESTTDIVYEQGITLLQKFENLKFHYYPVITCATGLTVELAHETASPFYIQQYYNSRDVLPRLIRKYLLNACVLVYNNDKDDVIVMTATGETIFTDKPTAENFVKLADKTFRTVTPDGNVYETCDAMRIPQEESTIKMTQRKDLENDSLVLTREDGLSMHFCEDGTLHVVYPDGTRFTTVLMEAEIEDGEFVLVDISVKISHSDYFPVVYNYCDESIVISGPSGFELSLHTDGSQMFRLDKGSALRAGSEEITWTVEGVNCESAENFVFQLSPESPDATLMTLYSPQDKMKVDCAGNVRYCSNSSQAYYEEGSPAGHLSMNNHSEYSYAGSGGDFYSELFVNNTIEEENANDLFSDSSIFVLSSDFSGFEILATTWVESLLNVIKDEQIDQEDRIVVQELDMLHPYYCKLILQALSRSSGNTVKLDSGNSMKGNVGTALNMISRNSIHLDWETGSKGVTFCTKASHLPSTYGADWSHPFHMKHETPCALLTQDVLTYRLFHRVNRKGHEILELFQQALEDLQKLDALRTETVEINKFPEDSARNFTFPPTGQCQNKYLEDDRAIAERFCLGNIPLRCGPDDVEYIRRLVHQMIGRATLLGNISWVNQQKQRLMDIVSMRHPVSSTGSGLSGGFHCRDRQKWSRCFENSSDVL